MAIVPAPAQHRHGVMVEPSCYDGTSDRADGKGIRYCSDSQIKFFKNACKGLLYTDGVLCVLSTTMTNQVCAVDPVDEFSLCLESLHGPCEPAGENMKWSSPIWCSIYKQLIDNTQVIVLCTIPCAFKSAYLFVLLCCFCEHTKADWSSRLVLGPGTESRSRHVILIQFPVSNLSTTVQ